MDRPASSATRGLLLALAAASFSGCATKGDMRDLQIELRNLAARQDSLIRQLRLDTRSTQDTLRETSDQLFAFRGDISRQLTEILDALATLEALAGQNANAIAGIRDQLAGMRRGTTAAGPGQAPGSFGGSDQVAGVGGGAEDLYNAAVDQYNRGQLATALAAFDQFVQQHPNHPWAADARFARADILVQQDRPEEAIEELERIPTLHPTHERTPMAQIRIARIEIEQGRGDDARRRLERFLATYPGSELAGVARGMLDEIG